MQPKVTLLSWTADPVWTIYRIWQASRNNLPVPENKYNADLRKEADEIFEKVIESKIPVAENLDFVFLLEGVSVSLREQLVRHRIGVKVDERIGFDIVPDLAESTWWSQSMRILDMGKFAQERRYRVPESLQGKYVDMNPDLAPEDARKLMLPAEHLLDACMDYCERTYNSLVKAGVPMEDAREAIPLGATHRLTWKLNLSALQHIIGKRGCWILQLGLWKPIIKGMVEELSTKVHPYFQKLIAPPCIKGGKFHECVFKLDNERRVSGLDDLPPCSLYLNHEPEAQKIPAQPKQVPEFARMVEEYRDLWKRDPFTWGALHKPEPVEEGDPAKEGMEGL